MRIQFENCMDKDIVRELKNLKNLLCCVFFLFFVVFSENVNFRNELEAIVCLARMPNLAYKPWKQPKNYRSHALKSRGS